MHGVDVSEVVPIKICFAPGRSESNNELDYEAGMPGEPGEAVTEAKENTHATTHGCGCRKKNLSESL